MASDAGSPSSDNSPGWGATLLNGVLVFASFLAFSLVQAPIPGPNEPHYLCKAKHYWDPQFCAGDLFLESADAHLVFYQTVGLLTRFLSLEQTALVGRIIGYGLLAFGWTRLISRLASSPLAPLWSAWVFLGIATFGNLSGEWIVGGIESKVLSYGLMLCGLAELADRRWSRAGILGGLSISFHPVVGCWGAIAAAMASAAVWGIGRIRGAQASDVGRRTADDAAFTSHHSPRTNRQFAVAAALLVVCALPGVIPAVGLLAASDAVDKDRADRIQIFERLPHHLDPVRFKLTELGDFKLYAAWIGYGFLFAFWLVLHRRGRPAGFAKWFGWFVIAATVIAVAGFVIGDMPRLANDRPDPEAVLLPLRIKLMKLYPFRLFDVILPIAVASVVVNSLRQASVDRKSEVGGQRAEGRGGAGGDAPNTNHQSPLTTWRAELVNLVMFSGFFAFSIVQPIADRNPSHMRPAEYEAWLETCRWVEANLPADAHVRTPHSSWAFKWYARRAEYFSNKDCPQDAKGILEWNRRGEYLIRWNNEKWDDGYSKAALAELLTKEKITHLIVYSRNAPAIDLRPIYPPNPARQSGFHIYRLRDAVNE